MSRQRQCHVYLDDVGHLPPEFVVLYETLTLELATPNPTYCADPHCGTFIPPRNYHGPDSARCSQCRRDTCRHCRSEGHAPCGCSADPATIQLHELASEQRWKSCPHCKAVVERTDGCPHIICRCGNEFCYSCGEGWTVRCMARCRGRE